MTTAAVLDPWLCPKLLLQALEQLCANPYAFALRRKFAMPLRSSVFAGSEGPALEGLRRECGVSRSPVGSVRLSAPDRADG